MNEIKYVVECSGSHADAKKGTRDVAETAAEYGDRWFPDCSPHRVVERLTDPEPWILDAVRVLERLRRRVVNAVDPAMSGVEVKQAVLDLLDAEIEPALRAVPEVWREAAREATP